MIESVGPTEVEQPYQACARHLDRPTGVRCQRCLAPICVDCMMPAAVGFQCPSCVATAAAKSLRMVALLARATPYLTYALIVLNLAVAVAGLVTADWVQGDVGVIGERAGLIGGGVIFNGRTLEVVGIDSGEWYRIVTGAFIHGGPVHLAFNMFALWQVGAIVESALGRARFALLYTVSVLGGAFGALLLEPNTLTVGASGGVFGLMGTLFIIDRARRSTVGFFIGVNLVFTLAVPGISVGGHFGGLAAGAAIGWVFHEFERRRLRQATPFAVALASCTTLFCGCLWAASLWSDPLF